MLRFTLIAIAILVAVANFGLAEEHARIKGNDYVVAVSKSTNANADWHKVVSALEKKHSAKIVVYDDLEDSLTTLQKEFPRYVCFVATSEEAGREFVGRVHRLTRKFDDDPYTDCIWGILTGYDAANALEIAQESKPLTIRRLASGTEIALEMCQEGKWFCELQQNRKVEKVSGSGAKELKGPGDTTSELVDSLNEYKPDAFVTSGHATERDWQIGFRYRNGKFISQEGQLTGVNIKGETFKIDSENPKVYMPIGNCLMGHIDGPDAMALAWMNSAGVRQMIGYTKVTWFGYGGWGVLDYFVEQPGRYTFAEAFHANHLALLHRLETEHPKLAADERSPEPSGAYRLDGGGLWFDRDVVAFYGDPAWSARMQTADLRWKQELTENDGVYTLTITPQFGEASFEPVNENGAQRGWRPIVEFLPQRMKNIRIIEGEELKPVVADNFILVPNPRKCDPAKTYIVRFNAETIQ